MRSIPVGLLVLAVGCATTAPAVSKYVKLRPETRSECAARCEEMGMRLGAVVLIQDSAGCVCEPQDSSSSAAGAAAVAGGAAVLSAERKTRANGQ